MRVSTSAFLPKLVPSRIASVLRLLAIKLETQRRKAAKARRLSDSLALPNNWTRMSAMSLAKSRQRPGVRWVRVQEHSPSRPQEIRQLRAIGYLSLDLQEMCHEIHDANRNRN
jgi:hypothetical protein